MAYGKHIYILKGSLFMATSLIGFAILNILYLILFFLIAVIYMVLNATDRKMLARRVFALPYIILGLLGVIFSTEIGTVSNVMSLAVPFVIVYILMVIIGIYALLWKPKEKISMGG